MVFATFVQCKQAVISPIFYFMGVSHYGPCRLAITLECSHQAEESERRMAETEMAETDAMQWQAQQLKANKPKVCRY